VSARELQLFEVLNCPTPEAWLQVAVARRDELLIDHANCEKKAASTALSLLFAYAEDRVLTERISRLAREELRHFEQVQRMMIALDVPLRRLKPSRYADGLRRHVRISEPGRLLDLLICGALIEARSCERFTALAPRLADPLSAFYRGLAEAEARHFTLYLDLAERAAGEEGAEELEQRRRELSAVEADLIATPDAQFRFHSGVPVVEPARVS
jgi:tRNA 2-(methylsulfanyl)-N6-isopentenyladenosine37 hydroxylase